MSYPVVPFTRERRAALSWREAQAVEAEFIQHAFRIVEAGCAAGSAFELLPTLTLDTLLNQPAPNDWWMAGLRLHGALIRHANELKDARKLAFLRQRFAEIFDFLLFAYDGDPAYPMAEMDRAFGSGIECGPILKLLWPVKAAEAVAAADRISAAEHEEQLRRQDQMGY